MLRSQFAHMNLPLNLSPYTYIPVTPQIMHLAATRSARKAPHPLLNKNGTILKYSRLASGVTLRDP